MKVSVLEIRVGDRILAYFNTKMQICTVKYVLGADGNTVALSVFTGTHYRHSASRIVRFRPDALIDLAA